MGNTHPLESLAAFAICFAAGALATAGLGAYIDKIKRDGQKPDPLFDQRAQGASDAARETP